MAQAKAKATAIGKRQPKAPSVKAKMPHKVTSYLLKFAAVSTPVILYTAAREEKIDLHQYHAECNGQIKQLGNFCPVCAGLGKDEGPDALDAALALSEVRLGKDEIFKGFAAGDRVIPITEEEIEAAKPDSAQVLEILEFVEADSIDPITFDSSFYLAPDTGAGASALKWFAVIREALDGDNKVGVARMVKSRHEYLAFIRPYGDDGLILYTAFNADEVRPMAFPELPATKPEEVRAAKSLIAAMTAEWDPNKYTDSYRANMNALIEAKRDGVEPPKIERKAPTSVGDDLMATLTASLELQKKKGKVA